MMSRKTRKPTIKELSESLMEMTQKHNNLVQYIQAVSMQFEQMSTMLHASMLQLGLATKSKCSNCDTEVVYPTLDDFMAHPVCPNANENEQCAEGFDYLDNPFEQLPEGQHSLEEYLGEDDEREEE
tara:strand:- start:1919 stop:2296 length:378 start_codon:yes stop_codon:yes gene_type:complete